MRSPSKIACAMAMILALSAGPAVAQGAPHGFAARPTRTPAVLSHSPRSAPLGVKGLTLQQLSPTSLAAIAGNSGAAAAIDDNIPGSELTTSPVTGALDAAGNSHDVYFLYLEQGVSVDFALTGDPGTDFRLRMFDSTASDVSSTTGLVAESPGGGYSQTIKGDAPATGYYMVDVEAVSGSGTYMLTWSYGYSVNDDVPGVAIPASPVSEWLDANWDWDDVYRVYLGKGDKLSLGLTTVSASSTPEFDLDLYVYGPAATTVDSTQWVANSAHDGNNESLAYAAPVSGDYYVDVFACPTTGSGLSLLTWSHVMKPSIARTPTWSKATFKRKRGVARFTLGARLTGDGSALSGRYLYLQSSKNGKTGWKNVTRLKTNSTGRVSKPLAIKKAGTTYYRWYAYSTATTFAGGTVAQKVIVR